VSKRHPATWEKKGTDLFTTKNIKKYPAIKNAASRTLNKIYKLDGRLFFCGREKYQDPSQSHPSGLYKTVLSHSIRQIDRYSDGQKCNFMMLLGRLDCHDSRSADVIQGGQQRICRLEMG